MTIKRIVCGFMVVVSSLCGAEEIARYQPQAMHADLDKFKKALVELHPGTYTHQSAQQFDALVNSLKSETAAPMLGPEFYKIVLRLIASIHDGHTQAFAYGDLRETLTSWKRLPFEVHIDDERIFVVRNLSDKVIPEGSEVVAIDGHLSNQILNEILRHYSSDGVSRNGLLHWLGGPYRPFYRLYPEIFAGRSVYRLTYRNGKTSVVETTAIEALSAETFEERKKKRYPITPLPNDPFKLTIDQGSAYALMTITRFIRDGYNDPENVFPDFYAQSFRALAEQDIKNLIIDLRDNGGGKASNAAYLLQYFIDSPLTPAKRISTLGDDALYDKWVEESLNIGNAFGLQPNGQGAFMVSRHDVLRDLKEYRPIKQHHFEGRLMVLINGGTASAGAVAAGLLKAHTNAILVGQETFGYAGISNGVRQVRILGDHTETAIYVPLLHAEYDMDPLIARRSVVPDRPVSPSLESILAGDDEVLEFALQQLKLGNTRSR